MVLPLGNLIMDLGWTLQTACKFKVYGAGDASLFFDGANHNAADKVALDKRISNQHRHDGHNNG